MLVDVTGWQPWRALRDRDDIVFALVVLDDSRGGAMLIRAGDTKLVLVDRRLTQAERKERLTHELIHDERDGVIEDPDQPATWADVVAREEGIVDRIVAERLVPLEDLATWLEVRDEPTEAHEVAVEFDVTDDVARRALAALIAQRAA